MKKSGKILITMLLLSILTGCKKESIMNVDSDSNEQESSKTVQEIATPTANVDTQETATPTAQDTPIVTEEEKSDESLKPHDWVMYPPVNQLQEYDFTNEKELLFTLNFSNYTEFPEKDKMPEGVSTDELLEWGKYPGLHMDVLHKYGLTGENAVVAIIDQPVLTEHEAFKDVNIIYHDLVVDYFGGDNSMHGGAVTSLLASPGIGTAPDATVHFFEDASWKADYQNTANAIYEIIETNKSLPENEKISMFSYSNYTFREECINQDKLLEAIKAAEDAGIWPWIADYPLKMNDGAFYAFVDKDDPNNVYTDYNSNATPWTDISWENVLTIPAGGRTTAYTYTEHMDEYTYWADGGVSWSVPYLCGLAATADTIVKKAGITE